MAKVKKKKSDQKYHSNVEDFIPYAAHFNEHTIITKNGELVQTIRITGFPSELVQLENEPQKSLRELIRESLLKHIQTDEYAIWFHTIRVQRDISTGGTYNNDFSRQLNEKWIASNKWRTQFVNELYITIIQSGESLPFRNLKIIIDNLFINTELEIKKAKILEKSTEFDKITDGIIDGLKAYGAEKLSIFKRDGIYYSEMISFINKILNLKEHDIPIAPANIASIMPTHKAIFQYNTVQVEGITGKHFGAILSVKQYHEITAAELEKLIQLPANIIISESFNFVDAEEAIEVFNEQKKIYDISGKKYMSEISGLEEIFATERNSTNFGEHQILVTVLEDTVKGLQSAISMVVDSLRLIGVPSVREDLFLENCYWSALPANFDFLKRQNYILTKKFGGFCSLYNFTTGKQYDNYWGDAVTIFPTTEGNPYFFNFHYNTKGHTAIIGGNEAERKLFSNFLISQAQKFDPVTYIIEGKPASKSFIEAMNGNYYSENIPSDLKQQAPVGISVTSPERLKEIFESILSRTSGSKPCLVALDLDILPKDAEGKVLLQTFMEQAEAKNIVVLINFSGSNDQFIFIGGEIYDLVMNKIYISNIDIDAKTSLNLGMKKTFIRKLKSFKLDDDNFMINRLNYSVIAIMDTKKINEFSPVLGLGEEKGK